jgi:hypothetical protein
MKWMISLVAAIVLGGIGFAEGRVAERSSPTEAKFLTVGDVSKVDLKNGSLTIKDAMSYNLAQLGNAGGNTAAGGGRGGGAGAVRGGGRGGRRGGGGSTASTPRGASAPIPTEFKVTFSSKTVIKEEEDHEIKIEDLKIGDRLQVYSMKGGSKLDALQISRTPKNNP